LPGDAPWEGASIHRQLREQGSTVRMASDWRWLDSEVLGFKPKGSMRAAIRMRSTNGAKDAGPGHGPSARNDTAPEPSRTHRTRQFNLGRPRERSKRRRFTRLAASTRNGRIWSLAGRGLRWRSVKPRNDRRLAYVGKSHPLSPLAAGGGSADRRFSTLADPRRRQMQENGEWAISGRLRIVQRRLR
jgi:hypothetical protein